MAWVGSLGARSRRVLSHLAIGLVAKLAAVVLMFVAMPLMLEVLGAEALGVWLVLFSVFQWLTFFDLGIVAGARNEIARRLATGEAVGVEKAISTGWFYAGVVALAVFAAIGLGLLLSPVLELLARHAFGGVAFQGALWAVVGFACLGLFLGFVQHIYAAFQRASAFSVFSLLTNAVFLLLLALLWWLDLSSLLLVAVSYGAAIVIANLALGFAFAKQDRRILPRAIDVDHSLRSRIFGFGTQLFVIQIAALVLFSTDRLLASWLLGPESVVQYDAAFKLFSLILMGHVLVTSTLWSSFTQAYAVRDWGWISRTLRVLMLLMVPVLLAALFLAWISPGVIRVWLGPEQVADAALYWWLSVFSLLFCWSNIFACVVNGIGILKVQLWSAIIAALVNIPASVFFARVLDQGLTGIVMGSVVSLLLFSVLGPIQVYLFVARRKPEAADGDVGAPESSGQAAS